MLEQLGEVGPFLAIYGGIAWVVFYTRFYVQWIVSEVKGRSVVPIAFWYQSAIGSVLLLGWAFMTVSFLGAIGQCLNLIPYSRNLIHIWREKGKLSPGLNVAVHIAVALVVAAGLAVAAYTGWAEYQAGSQAREEEAHEAILWLVLGLAGQGLFGSRFLIQWLVTEYKRKSVVPAAFWYVSLAAALMMFIAFAGRGEGDWLYAAGMAATMLIYARNIMLIHAGRSEKTIGKAAKKSVTEP